MTWHRRLAVVAALVFALAGLASAPASALGKVTLGGCPIGVAAVDPIIHPHDPVGTGHPHQFYGNQAPIEHGNTTTYADMIAAPVPCQNVGDTAGYWSPPVEDAATGQPIAVQQFTDYWRCPNGKPNGCPGVREIPADARIVARQYNWTCGQNSGALSVPSPTIPKCDGQSGKPGHTLTSHITFPSCWDGVLNDHAVTGDDSEHFAYPTAKACPVNFPIGVTQLRETVQYKFVGDPAMVILASDAEAGTTQGRSLHGDLWQTWQPGADPAGPTTLQPFVDQCVAPAKQAKGCG